MSYRSRKSTWIVTALALFVLAGCSSGTQSSDSDQPGDPTANAAPAGTDAVPPTVGPDGQPAVDPNAPPPIADAGAAPPADPNAAPPPVADPNAPAPAGDPLAANAAPAAPAPAPATDPAAAAPAAAPEPAKAPDPAPTQVAAAAPAADTKSPASDDSSGGSENYTVQNGDTLMKIAFETYGDLFKWRKIYSDNQDRIQDPNHVPPGTVLRLEKSANPVQVSRNGTPYLIKSGDTLGTISDDVYGTKTKWKRLWENNRELIKDPNRIFAGFTLYYDMTPQDRQELEQFRSKPQPLAQSTVDSAREPASQTN